MSSLLDRPTDDSPPPTRDERRFLFTKLAFMVASFISLCLSVGLWIAGEREQAIFVGLWVPSIHSLGTLVLTGERERR